MGINEQAILIAIVVALAAGYYVYDKKKKKNKKKKSNPYNPGSNLSSKNPVPGIKIKTEGSTTHKNFVGGMNVIKKGNPNLYKKIVAKTSVVTIMPGHKVINGKADKTWMAEAPINGNWITFYAATMAIYEKKYDTAHLWARVITHEYGHLIGYRHDTPSSTKAMNAWVTRQVKSFGGKVNVVRL